MKKKKGERDTGVENGMSSFSLSNVRQVLLCVLGRRLDCQFATGWKLFTLLCTINERMKRLIHLTVPLPP